MTADLSGPHVLINEYLCKRSWGSRRQSRQATAMDQQAVVDPVPHPSRPDLSNRLPLALQPRLISLPMASLIRLSG